MENPSFLFCPSCQSDAVKRSTEKVICTNCGKEYPCFRGIVDFRDQNIDATAGFSFKQDRVIANQLLKLFDKVCTFNELKEIFSVLQEESKATLDLSELSLDGIMKKKSICSSPLDSAQRVHGHDILAKIEMHLREVNKQLPMNGLALENGCGLGYFVDGLATKYKHVVVVDFSLAYLVLAKKMSQEIGHKNITFVCSSVERLPFKNNSFSFIHSNNVIEHVSNQRAMFKEAYRVLSGNGLLFVLSPNRFSIYIEPHFRLAAYGFIPEKWRRKIIWKRQNRSIDDISLVSLGELRTLIAENFGKNFCVRFIPRHIETTITRGMIRDFIVWSLNSKFIGWFSDLLVNKIFLGLMPYHVALCFKRKDIDG